MLLKDYPNIIFDLGGVILNLDYNLTIQAFEDLGLADFRTSFTQLEQAHFFDKYERGEIDTTTFRTELKGVLPLGTTDLQIDRAWNAMLLNLPTEHLLLLRGLM